MRRGDVVLVRFSQSPAGKARPCVVVRRDDVQDVNSKVTVCPFTSQLCGDEMRRPLIEPTAQNRLRAPSEVEVDWIFTHPVDRIGATIGRLDAGAMV